MISMRDKISDTMGANCSNFKKSKRTWFTSLLGSKFFSASSLQWIIIWFWSSVFCLNVNAQTQLIYTTPGSSTSAAMPTGVTNVTVQTWGAGGAGGGSGTNKKS